MTIFESAPAKINLFLDVTGKRKDGFHDILSVMQTVSLCDEISLTLSPADKNDVTLTCSIPSLPTDHHYLMVRAALRYLEGVDGFYTICMHLTKHIPVAAGLAGGSSDAAAVLRGLNRLLKVYTKEELLALASSIGSDVPFCLVGGTMLCRGKGEILSDYPAPPNFTVLVAKTNDTVSTPLAYRKLDERYNDFSLASAEKFTEASGEASRASAIEASTEVSTEVSSENSRTFEAFRSRGCACMYNIFEDAVLPLCPQTERLMQAIAKTNPVVVKMSGSGPSVFAFFETKEQALQAEKTLGELAVFSAVVSFTPAFS